MIELATMQDGTTEASERSPERPEGPLRRCIVTGELRPKAELLRFVIGPGATLVPDIKGVLPGRGLWLLPQRPIIDKACKRQLFARAARVQVCVPEDLPLQVAQLLRRRCLDLIGLAKRAGQAVSGFEQVRPWLASGRAKVLLAAADGAADGRQRLKALGTAQRPGLPLIEDFSSAELGAALGRDKVVHAALSDGGLAEALIVEAARLAGVLAEG